jgi:hypothetical protein
LGFKVHIRGRGGGLACVDEDFRVAVQRGQQALAQANNPIQDLDVRAGGGR